MQLERDKEVEEVARSMLANEALERVDRNVFRMSPFEDWGCLLWAQIRHSMRLDRRPLYSGSGPSKRHARP
ncbi:hypothetical protein [Variovorax sp. 770b2]|uniref:hypothetical protein n=1 Tax=Variovorax sp. 770b2 TaxID=1566271 RepID=UPI0011606998|nr:hypothetical protein [Variovorax sp. 770b2]